MFVQVKHKELGLVLMLDDRKVFPPSYTTDYLKDIYRQVFKEGIDYSLEYTARAVMYIWNATHIGPKPRSPEAIDRLVREARSILENGAIEVSIKNTMY